MHVAHLGFFLDPVRTPLQILEDWWPLVDTAEMVAGAGVQVTVIQSCKHTETVVRGGVTYHFLATPAGGAGMGETDDFARLLESLRLDLVHVHGLGFARDVLALSHLSRPTPIFLQDHANRPPTLRHRARHRRAFEQVAAVSFCARAQAQPFIRAGMIRSQTVFEIPECSSRFTTGDQRQARALTGVHGNPAVLWVGHLDANKDPLPILEGTLLASPLLPDLQLWCCFGTAPLLADVERRIARKPWLAGRVHLLGKVPHATIELLMRAADAFVLGSHREGSGCSLIEALACGLPPAVTDIPSYRVLTGEGAVGALWSCGKPRELAEALASIAGRPKDAARIAARGRFDRELSFEAMGRKLVAAYGQLLGRR